MRNPWLARRVSIFFITLDVNQVIATWWYMPVPSSLKFESRLMSIFDLKRNTVSTHEISCLEGFFREN